MHERVKRLMRYGVTIGRQAAFQVTVSLIATVCVGLVTNDRSRTETFLSSPGAGSARSVTSLERIASLAQPVDFDPQPVASLLRASFTADRIRVRPGHPTEFGALFGPAPDKPYTELAPSTWSEPEAPVIGAVEQVEAKPLDAAEPRPIETVAPKLQAKATVPHQGCTGDCGRRMARIDILPPSRPASLAHKVPEASPSQAVSADKDSQESAPSLLGFQLPGFVPASKAVMRTAASLGYSVSGLLDGIR